FSRSEGATLLLGSIAIWVSTAVWFEVYDRIQGVDPRIIIRDASLQCLLGAVSVVLIEYALRLNLSRVFLAAFLVFTWMLLNLFRLNSIRILGMVQREFVE